VPVWPTAAFGRLDHHKVAYFFFGEFAKTAAGKVFLGKAGKNDSVEFVYVVAEVFEETADDAVLAAVEFHPYNALVVGPLDILYVVDVDGAVLEFDTFEHLFHVVARDGFV